MAKIIPNDPTGQRLNRARTTRRLNKRLESARGQIISLFRAIPWTRRTVEKVRNQPGRMVVYDYDLSPEQAEILGRRIRGVLDDLLLQLTGDNVPANWWFKVEVEQPVRQAFYFKPLKNVPQQIATETILSSPKYLQELRTVYMENFQVIKTLSDNTAAQVIRTINTGIKAGNTPTEIAKNINTRFDVSQSNAERIARTEVNRAYNDAKIRATETAGEISGLPSYVRHLSALLPERTRKHHAARHYLVYTVEQQNKWWDSEDGGTNRINCLCTVRPVIKDNEGHFLEA